MVHRDPRQDEINAALWRTPELITDGVEQARVTVRVGGTARSVLVDDGMLPTSAMRARARAYQRVAEVMDPAPVGYTVEPETPSAIHDRPVGYRKAACLDHIQER